MRGPGFCAEMADLSCTLLDQGVQQEVKEFVFRKTAKTFQITRMCTAFQHGT